MVVGSYDSCRIQIAGNGFMIELVKTRVYFLTFLFFAAFALNLVWEMAHMRAYVEMTDSPWQETFPRCALASVGDAVTTLGILLFYALLRRRLTSGQHLNGSDYLWL